MARLDEVQQPQGGAANVTPKLRLSALLRPQDPGTWALVIVIGALGALFALRLAFREYEMTI